MSTRLADFATAAENTMRHSLSDLAVAINSQHAAVEKCAEEALEHCCKCGELLIHAKKRVGHGKWQQWVKQNLRFTDRRARHYMEAANRKRASVLTWDDWQRISGHARVKVNKPYPSVEWYTPEDVLDLVRFYFRGPIPLDPCTSPKNHTGAKRFLTEQHNGLAVDWHRLMPKGAFVNPPYGNLMEEWSQKIHLEAAKGLPIVALLPCGTRFSTGYWQDHILNDFLRAVCFVRGRLSYTAPQGHSQQGNNHSPCDSAIYGYNIDQHKFCKAFNELGKVLLIKSSKAPKHNKDGPNYGKR